RQRRAREEGAQGRLAEARQRREDGEDVGRSGAQGGGEVDAEAPAALGADAVDEDDTVDEATVCTAVLDAVEPSGCWDPAAPRGHQRGSAEALGGRRGGAGRALAAEPGRSLRAGARADRGRRPEPSGGALEGAWQRPDAPHLTQDGEEAEAGMTLEDFVGRLDNGQRAARGYPAGCPAHESQGRENLAGRAGDGGRVLGRGAGGCGPAQIGAALGVE